MSSLQGQINDKIKELIEIHKIGSDSFEIMERKIDKIYELYKSIEENDTISEGDITELENTKKIKKDGEQK